MNTPIETAAKVINTMGVVAEAMLDSLHEASTFPADVGIGQLLN